MQWSKLKSRVEESFADSIKGRIQIFTTAYRRQDDISRSWVVIDGKQEVSLTDSASWWEQGAYFHELTPTDCLQHKAISEENRKENKIHEHGEFSSYDFKIMAFESLSLSALDCTSSEHPLLRALGVLNKKTGKAKVKALQKDKHPMVAYFAKFRTEAEATNKALKRN
ncbi:MAG: SF0329 family protein [Thalassotalea sp.]